MVLVDVPSQHYFIVNLSRFRLCRRISLNGFLEATMSAAKSLGLEDAIILHIVAHVVALS